MTTKPLKLTTGRMEYHVDADGWIITSSTARLAAPDDNINLLRGDMIRADGRIWRNREIIATV